MSSEKSFKRQRNALVDVVKKLIFIETSNPFCSDEVRITLPRIPDMNKENIKPILELALGYVPEILLYQETEIPGKEKNERIPVVLIVFMLK